MSDPVALLRRATRRAKSDVANKLVSMFLHELSRRLSRSWRIKVDGAEYEDLVRQWFRDRCPYCLRGLTEHNAIVEHLDGMNRYRAGLHIPGNVLVACKQCNSEKRRDDSARSLSLADSGWESFLSHNGTRCAPGCRTCQYWKRHWTDDSERISRLEDNLSKLRSFRRTFSEFEETAPSLRKTLPTLLEKLYLECQSFAESEIHSLLIQFEQATGDPKARRR